MNLDKYHWSPNSTRISDFWTPGLPIGVHSNRPCPSVRLSVFKYLGDRSLVFSETLHEVRGQLSKKSDTAEIWKKILIRGLRGIRCKKLLVLSYKDQFCSRKM